MDIKDFEGKSPEFLPEQFLVGQLEGWGILESVTGGLQKRFTVKAEGVWNDSSQTVHFTETWTFDDEFSDTLSWKILKHQHGSYSGLEPRLDGRAKGEQAGFLFIGPTLGMSLKKTDPAPS